MTLYANPGILVETDWLARNIDLPELRIFDCTAHPAPNPDKEQRHKYPLKPQSGRLQYEKQHIKGAGFIDIPDDLTDKNTDTPMMMPPIEQIVDVAGRCGIGNDTFVVLYSSTGPMWAARFWWQLRAAGFDNAAILNGGLKKWLLEDRITSTEACTYEAAELTPRPRTDVFVDKNRVLTALDENNTLLIHSLTPEIYSGNADAPVFGRRGRIPGSINIPSATLQNTETGAYLSSAELNHIFRTWQVHNAEQIITYCGGGINASNNAFVLKLLGYKNIAIYDGSMSEWGNDHSLPIEL